MSIVDRIEQMSVYQLQLPVRSVRSHGSGSVAQQVDAFPVANGEVVVPQQPGGLR